MKMLQTCDKILKSLFFVTTNYPRHIFDTVKNKQLDKFRGLQSPTDKKIK